MTDAWPPGAAFQWQPYIVGEMLGIYEDDDWSDLEAFYAEFGNVMSALDYAKAWVEGSFGLRCTVTLQNEDDERKVRLLKDGQRPDPGEQCSCCSHIGFGDPAYGQPAAWCVFHKPGYPDCPDWAEE